MAKKEKKKDAVRRFLVVLANGVFEAAETIEDVQNLIEDALEEDLELCILDVAVFYADPAKGMVRCEVRENRIADVIIPRK